MANAGNFEKALRAHDWYYAYSDDFGVWRRGEAALDKLRAQAEALKCPFSLNELRMFVHEMILEEFEEREPGKYYRKGETSRYVASTQLSDLIPQSKADEIRDWLKANDSL